MYTITGTYYIFIIYRTWNIYKVLRKHLNHVLSLGFVSVILWREFHPVSIQWSHSTNSLSDALHTLSLHTLKYSSIYYWRSFVKCHNKLRLVDIYIYIVECIYINISLFNYTLCVGCYCLFNVVVKRLIIYYIPKVEI